MDKSSTLFLKIVVWIIGLGVLALCVVVLPIGIRAEDVGGYRPILIGMYVPAIPFFIGIYQTLKLLQYIDRHKAFSELSVRALQKIKYCTFVVSALYAAGMPFIFRAAEKDDAPGVIVIGLVFTFAPLVVGVFAAVLQKLLQEALMIKAENDLTV